MFKVVLQVMALEIGNDFYLTNDELLVMTQFLDFIEEEEHNQVDYEKPIEQPEVCFFSILT